MKFHSIIICAALLWEISASATTCHLKQDKLWLKTTDNFKKILEKVHKQGDAEFVIPGGALAIITEGDQLRTEGFGFRSKDSTEPVTADTVITIGSISKLITSLLAVKLEEENQLSLSNSIEGYAPGLLQRSEVYKDWVKKLTIKNALQHTAGLPDELPSGIDEFGESVCLTDEEGLSSYFSLHRNDPLWVEPGLVWNYSNANYMLAAAAIEQSLGRSFSHLSDSLIFEPLQLENTTFNQELIDYQFMADGYDFWQGEFQSFTPHSTPCSVYDPAAGLNTSVKDLAKLAADLLADHPSVISASSLKKMQDSRVPTGDDRWDYGLGMLVNESPDGSIIFGHDGIAWGYSTVLLMVPREKFAVVAFVHGGGTTPTNLWEFAEQVVEDFTGKKALPMRDSKPQNLAQFDGVYQVQSYGDDYTEGEPTFKASPVDLSYDAENDVLYWQDEFGLAPLVSRGGTRFQVTYDNPAYNFTIRLESREGQPYIVNRNFVGALQQEKASTGSQMADRDRDQ